MSSDDNEEPEREQPWDDPNWLPENAASSLAMERAVHPEENEEQTARRLLRESAPNATMAILHLAMHGTNERTRLDASKYILERVLGKVGDDVYDGDLSPITSFIKEVTQYVDTHST